MNQVNLVATIASLDEYPQTGEKKAFTRFSLAINSGKNKTTWVNVSSFDKTAEFINNNFVVGMTISVMGSLHNFDNDGKQSLGLTANSVGFVPGTKSKKMVLEGKSNASTSDEDPMSHIQDIPEEDLPF